MIELAIKTHGEMFYEITDQVKKAVKDLSEGKSGVCYLFNPHTSCGLTISEAYAPEAKTDLESFLKHLAPRNLSFITHDDEGEDDSPSHMKSILLETTLTLLVEKGELVLGQWQGIYLAEFRDDAKTRRLKLKMLF